MYEHLDNFIKKHNITFDYNKYSKNELYIINQIAKKNKIIESNNPKINNFIGLFIKEEYINIAKEYFIKSIEFNDVDSIINYSDILINNKSYFLAKKYLLKGFELDNNNYLILKYLGILYEKENNLKEASKYYLKSIELNGIKSLNHYLNLAIPKLKKYYDLSNLKNKSLIENKLLEYEKDINITKFKNKIKNFSVLQNCGLCNNYDLNIQLDCFLHFVCIYCYIDKNEKCTECNL